MNCQFDPYHKWLGIPSKNQPPNHYRLLGVDLFEADAEVIEAASLRHIRFLREIHDGPHVRQAQKLLNEITVARLCLLDEAKKSRYDDDLRQRIAHRRPVVSERTQQPPKAPPANGRRDDSNADSSRQPPTTPPCAASAADTLRAPPVVVGAVVPMRDGKHQRGKHQRGKGKRHPVSRLAWVTRTWWGPATVSATLAGLLWAVLMTSRNEGRPAPEVSTSGAVAQADPKSPASADRDTVKRVGSADSTSRISNTAPLATNARPSATRLESPAAGDGPSTDHPLDDQTQQSPLEIPADLFGPSSTTEPALAPLSPDARSAVRVDDAHGAEDRSVNRPDPDVSPTNRSPAMSSPRMLLSGDSPSETFKGSLIREVWNCTGNQVSDILAHVELHPEADQREEIRQFATAEDAGDQYGQRITGYLHPPLTGDYVFKIRANAEGLLLVSRDADVANTERIESNRRLALEAGHVYYVEAWHKESTGRDYFSVGWKLPDGVEEDPIPGHRLSTEPRYRAPHETGFVVVAPAAASGNQGTVLSIADDATIVASGPHRRDEVYRVTLAPRWPTISGIRLEAMPHDTLPANGPGRGPGGRFSLAQIKIMVASKSGAAADRDVDLISVASDFESPVEHVADGSLKTFWSVRNSAAVTTLTLVFAQPVQLAPDRELSVEVHNREALGCFRLLATSVVEPADLPIVPATPKNPVAPDSNAPDSKLPDAWFLNLGGNDWTDGQGTTWIQSKPFEQAGIGHEGGRSVVAETAGSPLAGSAIRGIQAFRASVPDGRYELSLFFCENWSRDARRRVFSVSVEGKPALVNFNLLGLAGGTGKPFVHRIPNVLIKDGRLDVEFEPAHGNALAILNAISFRRTGALR